LAIRVILIGPPGVGKGTQAALLEASTGARPVSSGLIFRAEIDAETDLGQLAKHYIDHGQLVPNGVTIQMIFKRLRQEEIRRKGFILDGFPRTIRQAESLTEELANEEIHLNGVISLETDEDIVVQRLSGRLGCTKCGEIYHSTNHPPHREGLCDRCNGPLFVREDDNPETIRQRLHVFSEQTAPVLDYYEGLGVLLRIKSEGSPRAVNEEVLRRLVP